MTTKLAQLRLPLSLPAPPHPALARDVGHATVYAQRITRTLVRQGLTQIVDLSPAVPLSIRSRVPEIAACESPAVRAIQVGETDSVEPWGVVRMVGDIFDPEPVLARMAELFDQDLPFAVIAPRLVGYLTRAEAEMMLYAYAARMPPGSYWAGSYHASAADGAIDRWNKAMLPRMHQHDAAMNMLRAAGLRPVETPGPVSMWYPPDPNDPPLITVASGQHTLIGTKD